jgi:hypothetical protein
VLIFSTYSGFTTIASIGLYAGYGGTVFLRVNEAGSGMNGKRKVISTMHWNDKLWIYIDYAPSLLFKEY